MEFVDNHAARRDRVARFRECPGAAIQVVCVPLTLEIAMKLLMLALTTLLIVAASRCVFAVPPPCMSPADVNPQVWNCGNCQSGYKCTEGPGDVRAYNKGCVGSAVIPRRYYCKTSGQVCPGSQKQWSVSSNCTGVVTSSSATCNNVWRPFAYTLPESNDECVGNN